MDLFHSKVPRALESKTKLFGFELGDLLIVFLYLSVSNLIFGQTRLKFPVVWLGTIGLGLALHIFKKGKPDNHLQHLSQYHRSPNIYSSGAPDLAFESYQPSKQGEEDQP